MKFLCVPCDTPMKLQTVVPPDRGSLSVVYSCPACGYEIVLRDRVHVDELEGEAIDVSNILAAIAAASTAGAEAGPA